MSEKESNECSLCKRLQVQLQESLNEIAMLNNNIRLLQERVINSKDLLAIYQETKAENEILKEQNKKLKEDFTSYKQENPIDVQITQYKQAAQHFDKVKDRGEALESANKLLAASTEDERKFKEDNKKLKHALKEKDKLLKAMEESIKMKDETLREYNERGGLAKIKALEQEAERLKGQTVPFEQSNSLDSLLESRIMLLLHKNIPAIARSVGDVYELSSEMNLHPAAPNSDVLLASGTRSFPTVLNFGSAFDSEAVEMPQSIFQKPEAHLHPVIPQTLPIQTPLKNRPAVRPKRRAAEKAAPKPEEAESEEEQFVDIARGLEKYEAKVKSLRRAEMEKGGWKRRRAGDWCVGKGGLEERPQRVVRRCEKSGLLGMKKSTKKNNKLTLKEIESIIASIREMPKSFKPTLLEYLLETDLDSPVLKAVAEFGKDLPVLELASMTTELCLIVCAKVSFVAALYKIMRLIQELDLSDSTKSKAFAESMRINVVSSSSLEEKSFATSFDSPEQIEKLLEILPLHYNIDKDHTETKTLVARLFYKPRSMLSFAGATLLHLCFQGRHMDLALAVFADFLERSVHCANCGKPTEESTLEFALRLVVFCPAVLCERAVKGGDREVESGQFDLAKHCNLVTQQAIYLSIKELIASTKDPLELLFNFLKEGVTEDSDIFEGNIFASMEDKSDPPASIKQLFEKATSALSVSPQYAADAKIALSLPESIWDLCSGLYVATLVLGLEWTYEEVYKPFVFALFCGSGRRSRGRVAAIALIGTLFKCQARNFPFVGEVEKIYKEYIAKLVLTVENSVPEITLHDKCWAAYWIIKVNEVNQEELFILKQWFDNLSPEDKLLLPHKLLQCLSNIN